MKTTTELKREFQLAMDEAYRKKREEEAREAEKLEQARREAEKGEPEK